MASNVFCVTPDTSIPELAQELSRRQISGAPVVDADGYLVGIVTEADLLLKAAGAPGGVPGLGMFFLGPHVRGIRRRIRRSGGRSVGEVMTTDVRTGAEDTTVRELAALMSRNDIGRIPIVRDGKVVGIVTRNDVLLVFARDQEEIRTAFIDALASRIDPSELHVSVSNGIISVTGTVERQSDVRLVEVVGLSLDGVVAVDTDGLRYQIADMSW
jgi:CBS domain-containing protein